MHELQQKDLSHTRIQYHAKARMTRDWSVLILNCCEPFFYIVNSRQIKCMAMARYKIQFSVTRSVVN